MFTLNPAARQVEREGWWTGLIHCKHIARKGDRMAAPARAIPQLHSGDRMTRFEFHRRYKAHPEIKKAELIEGVVVLASPLNAERHGDPHADVMYWLGSYRSKHRGVKVSDNATVILDADNEVQPDASLRRLQGGTTRSEQGYLIGPPELVVEISASSVSIDLHSKLEAYRRNGVGEYIVWRVDDAAIDWFRLEEGAYVRVEPDAGGVIESGQFPGLRLPVAAMLEGDVAAVAAAVR
jgi:Uma2 family endonuclease